MPRRQRNRRNKGQKTRSSRGGSGNGTVSWEGPFGSKWGVNIPLPRIPRKIGTVSLSAGNAVYPRVNLDFPVNTQVFAMGSGVLASVQNIDTSLVPGFSTRVATMFNEYAIVGLRLEFRVNQVLNPSGFVLVYVDEKSNATPTLADGRQTDHMEIAVVTPSTQQIQTLTWKASDLLDLQWTDTLVNSIPLYLKLFSSVAGTYTLANSSCQILMTGSIALALRGYSV